MHRLARLAALALLPFAAATHAQSKETEDEAVVIVTATRFAEPEPKPGQVVSTIPRQEIRGAAATNLPDLLRQRAGIEVRSLSGALAMDATVDLRGFGEAAGSNVLVLVDGQRMNAVDSGSVIWSAIPLSNVERIEILRGAGTVLYGDRAVGGVINIVTDKSGAPGASVGASAGYYGYRAAEARLSGGGARTPLRLTASWAESEGYRRNGQGDRQALSGRAGLVASPALEAFADVALFEDTSGLPGALFSARYAADPSFSRRPFDTQRRAGYRVRPGFAWQAADRLAVEGEIGVDHTAARVDQPGFRQDRDRDNLSFTPRLRWRHDFGTLPSDTILGMDAYDSEVEARSDSAFSGPNTQTARQRSAAVYLQNTTWLDERFGLTAGARRQRLKQEADDAQSGASGRSRRTLDAYELGAEWKPAPRWRVVGRVGRSFRFPNTDELFGFDPVSFDPIFRGDLRPQRGNSVEIGAAWRGASTGMRATLYRLNLKDEIGLDNATFTNVNLPRTRRQGLEIEADVALGAGLRLRASYTLASATFREGPDSGRTVPLVARHKGSLGLDWDAGGYGRHGLAVAAVGRRHYAGDTANALPRLPGHAVVDWRSDWISGPWQFTLRALNLLDKKYASFAGFQAFPANDFFYYPAEPRTVIGTVGYAWK